jgi:hypothetical protein
LKQGSEAQLREELEHLKHISGLGSALNLVWAPDPGKALSGEVKGSTVYIYDESEKQALDTLRHEFFDYCISKAIQPYRQVTNTLIKLLNENAYTQKEEIVEGLRKIAFTESKH